MPWGAEYLITGPVFYKHNFSELPFLLDLKPTCVGNRSY